MARNQISFAVARDIRSNWDDVSLAEHLTRFGRSWSREAQLFQSFVVIFQARQILREAEFERHMWRRLQSLSDKDSLFGARPDPRVAADPDDAAFGLSFGGEAFFVVGLHPGASRPARRFERCALVFNLHEQFTRLRAANKYEAMRKAIVERDIRLAGNINPMLARHGEVSEARQYSGRAVNENWRCPFKRKEFTWMGSGHQLVQGAGEE